MRRWLIISGVIHGLLILLAIIGLPYLKKPPIEMAPIPIRIADISELTSSPVQDQRPPAPTKPTPTPVEPKPEPPKPTPPAPAPPAHSAPTPPQVAETPPEPREPKPPPPMPEPPPTPEPAAKPPEKKPVEPKPQVAAAAPAKPKPPKPEETPKPFDITKLLRDVRKNNQQDQPPQPQKTAQPAASVYTPPASAPNLSSRLTSSEIDALRDQLRGCWNFNAGARDAADLAVVLEVEVNPDRTVQSITVLDADHVNSDSYLRSAAEAAMRALRNPNCSPLKLPPEKYETWRKTTMNFNPRDMQ